MIDSPHGRRGRDGERAIADLIRRRGGYIVPSYDYSGLANDKPPRLHGLHCAYAIPDLDIATKQGRIWLEVKTYTRPTFYRKIGEWQHGIRSRLWRHYCDVERLTHTPVWICVYELESQEVLVARQKCLVAYGEFRNDQQNSQFYFARSAMNHYAWMSDYPDLVVPLATLEFSS